MLTVKNCTYSQVPHFCSLHNITASPDGWSLELQPVWSFIDTMGQQRCDQPRTSYPGSLLHPPRHFVLQPLKYYSHSSIVKDKSSLLFRTPTSSGIYSLTMQIIWGLFVQILRYLPLRFLLLHWRWLWKNSPATCFSIRKVTVTPIYRQSHNSLHRN